MDKKDERILKELIINSRIPINQLAKKVGVSREVAIYRIKNLKKEVITGFYTIINTKSLGFNRYVCFLQLKDITKEQEKQYFDYLKNNGFITYFAPAVGTWNVVFDILAKDKEQLSEITKDITKEISKNLTNIVILEIQRLDELAMEKLIGEKKLIRSKAIQVKKELDKIDKQILKFLSQDSRLEYKEIGKRLNLTYNAIKHRIKNLEKNGVIIGHTISLDINKLGFDSYDVQIKLLDFTGSNKILNYIKFHPKVIYSYNYLGNQNWDIDLGVVVKNTLELRDFILELRENFGDIMLINDIYPFVEVAKESLPDGIFN